MLSPVGCFVICIAFMTIGLTAIAVLEGSGNLGGYIVFAILVFLFLTAYFFPAIFMYANRNDHRQSGLVLNLLFAWLGIPWIILLIWARRSAKERTSTAMPLNGVNVGFESNPCP